MNLHFFLITFYSTLVAFCVEEFILIKPNPGSKLYKERFFTAWMWAIGLGIGATAFTTGIEIFRQLLFGGVGNLTALIAAWVGIAVRFVSRLKLGRFFTVRVTIFSDHKLVDSGIYRRIRHPGYLGFLMFFFSWPLIVGNPVGTFFLSLPNLIAVLLRIEVEEEAMVEAFGKVYIDYQKRTYKLIPYVW